MNKAIRTYDDLLEYKTSLQRQLQDQKELIYYDLGEIKDELKPITETIKKISHFFVPSKDSSWLVRGTNSVIDMLLRNVFLRKSGWMTKTVVPFLVENISSHLVSKNKHGIIQKILTLFSKRKK
jgi:hypothetical protein